MPYTQILPFFGSFCLLGRYFAVVYQRLYRVPGTGDGGAEQEDTMRRRKRRECRSKFEGGEERGRIGIAHRSVLPTRKTHPHGQLSSSSLSLSLSHTARSIFDELNLNIYQYSSRLLPTILLPHCAVLLQSVLSYSVELKSTRALTPKKSRPDSAQVVCLYRL